MASYAEPRSIGSYSCSYLKRLISTYHYNSECKMTDMKKIVPFYYSISGNMEEDKKLLEPAEYSLQCNDIHPYRRLTSIFNYWFKISPDKFQQIDEVMQMAYNVGTL
ncbi:uncharacterized protein [Mycetomoellerius zeteki]|uniref:uncharacterized protein n=1 Tax=Mycetomoellerius zeteki TaxID=64791 RepID=UPI00084E5485|nr:PREDICTED: uncharacterized protein LOC108722616 [Trachymyrmex zeteki]